MNVISRMRVEFQLCWMQMWVAGCRCGMSTFGQNWVCSCCSHWFQTYLMLYWFLKMPIADPIKCCLARVHVECNVSWRCSVTSIVQVLLGIILPAKLTRFNEQSNKMWLSYRVQLLEFHGWHVTILMMDILESLSQFWVWFCSFPYGTNVHMLIRIDLKAHMWACAITGGIWFHFLPAYDK